jgi:hypothetical protein
MRARLVLVPIALAAALVAGCNTKSDPGTTTPPAASDNGVANLSADEILARATTALNNAKSFKAKGEMDSDGTKVTIDMQFSGKDFKGNLSGEGMQFEIIRIGNDIYLKAPDDVWKTFLPPGQDAALALLRGKYVKVDASMPQFAALAGSMDTSEILKPEGAVTKGEAKVVNGIPTIALKDGADNGTLYIATQGEPYPIRIEGPAAEGGAIDFTDFNASVTIAAPAAGEVFDLKSIVGG